MKDVPILPGKNQKFYSQCELQQVFQQLDLPAMIYHLF